MPAVTVPPSPNGLPIAITGSPTRTLSESAKVAERQRSSAVDLDQREVGVRILADHLGRQLAAVLQGDGDLVGAVDDVVVGDDQAVVVDDEAGAHRGRRQARAKPGGIGIERLHLLAEEALHEALDHLAVGTLLAEAELEPRGRGTRAGCGWPAISSARLALGGDRDDAGMTCSIRSA